MHRYEHEHNVVSDTWKSVMRNVRVHGIVRSFCSGLGVRLHIIGTGFMCINVRGLSMPIIVERLLNLSVTGN